MCAGVRRSARRAGRAPGWTPAKSSRSDWWLVSISAPQVRGRLARALRRSRARGRSRSRRGARAGRRRPVRCSRRGASPTPIRVAAVSHAARRCRVRTQLESPGDAAVDHENPTVLWNGNRADGQCEAVEQECVRRRARVPTRADPSRRTALRSRQLLRLLRDEREFGGSMGSSATVAAAIRECDAERRARRQPRADRHRARGRRVEPDTGSAAARAPRVSRRRSAPTRARSPSSPRPSAGRSTVARRVRAERTRTRPSVRARKPTRTSRSIAIGRHSPPW